MENGPFIDGLPITNGGSFHGGVYGQQFRQHEKNGFLKSLDLPSLDK